MEVCLCSMLSEPRLAGSGTKDQEPKAPTSGMASSFMCQVLGMKDRLSCNVDQSTCPDGLSCTAASGWSTSYMEVKAFVINALCKRGENCIAFYDLASEVP